MSRGGEGTALEIMPIAVAQAFQPVQNIGGAGLRARLKTGGQATALP
jgi:hypothetical protein